MAINSLEVDFICNRHSNSITIRQWRFPFHHKQINLPLLLQIPENLYIPVIVVGFQCGNILTDPRDGKTYSTVFYRNTMLDARQPERRGCHPYPAKIKRTTRSLKNIATITVQPIAMYNGGLYQWLK